MEKLKLIIVIIIAASFLCKIAMVFSIRGLWWDEAVYLGLGKNLASGTYSLDTTYPVESFRPPLFPFLISLFHSSIPEARIFVCSLSLICILAIYFLFREKFGKRIALWSSFFLSTNAMFIFFTTKVLSETLFMIFLTVCIFFYLTWAKSGRNRDIFLSGVFAGLAFITRYFASILILSCMLSLFFAREGKPNKLHCILCFTTGVLLVVSPWFALGVAYYNNPVGALLVNGKIFLSSIPDQRGVLQFFDAFGFQLLFFVLGIITFFRVKIREKTFLLLLTFLSFAAFFSMHHKEARYLLSFMPVYALISSFGVEHMAGGKTKKILMLIALAVGVASTFHGLNVIVSDRDAALPLVEACEFVKENIPHDAVVMTQSFPYAYYFLENDIVAVTGDVQTEEYYINEKKMFENKLTWEDVWYIVNKHNVSYAIVYAPEPENPDYVQNFFKGNKFELIRTFGEGQNEARIYKIKEKERVV